MVACPRSIGQIRLLGQVETRCGSDCLEQLAPQRFFILWRLISMAGILGYLGSSDIPDS
jgi:hypothetical protein